MVFIDTIIVFTNTIIGEIAMQTRAKKIWEAWGAG